LHGEVKKIYEFWRLASFILAKGSVARTDRRCIALRIKEGSADWLEEKKEPNLSSLHRLPILDFSAPELINIDFLRESDLSEAGRADAGFGLVTQSRVELAGKFRNGKRAEKSSG
jgi:hypothetical protein